LATVSAGHIALVEEDGIKLFAIGLQLPNELDQDPLELHITLEEPLLR
jgi:hypothetical protein